MNPRSWSDDWARCDACRRMYHPDELETLCDDELCPSCFGQLPPPKRWRLATAQRYECGVVPLPPFVPSLPCGLEGWRLRGGG